MAVFDISQLSEQNTWWVDKKNVSNDAKIATFNKQKYRWDPRIRHYIRLEKDVIYTVRGPRQVGKTTLLKLIIQDLLLNKNIKSENIFFWSCERNNAEELHQILQTYLDWRISAKDERKYIFLDEICAVKDWPKELIYFANKGVFTNCSIIMTGSHSMDIKHSTELMPGRRGGEDNNPLDKILLPMKFSEFVELIWPEFKDLSLDMNIISNEDKTKKIMSLFKGKIDEDLVKLSFHKKQLDSLLDLYLLTGGIPATINELKSKDSISTNLFNIYLNAMIGDLHRYGYKEHYFKQIVREIFNALSSPISWNSFTKHTEIRSHDTVQDYILALEELYVSNVSYKCTIHDKRIYTDWKKLYIQDPFIFHALHGWSNNKKDYFSNAKSNVLDLEMKSKLIESVVYNHLCRLSFRLNPRDLFDPKDNICYYRDDSGKEVDFVLLYDEELFPFEVKYQATISPSDFFAFAPFKRGILITKDELKLYRNYAEIPVSMFLLLI